MGSVFGDAVNQRYFSEYANLKVHELMLKDRPRTEAYLAAIENCEISGKVVMDVGAGTGILSMFAARAGAKKVYAVEASDFADVARALVEANGYSDTVEVIHGMVEDVNLSEKVDVIISEWMGFYLLHESMFLSVLYARDKWLKPGGILLPTFADISVAPVSMDQMWADKFEYWDNVYGLDFSCLQPMAKAEAMQEPTITDVSPSQLFAPAQEFARFDLRTVTANEITRLSRHMTFTTATAGNLHGFCLWFCCGFIGPPGNEDDVTKLDTAPGRPKTHWQQTVVLLPDGYPMELGEEIPVRVSMHTTRANPRFYSVTLAMGEDEGEIWEEEEGEGEEGEGEGEEMETDTAHEAGCECMECKLHKAVDSMYNASS